MTAEVANSRRTFGPLGRMGVYDGPDTPGRCRGLGEPKGLRPKIRQPRNLAVRARSPWL